jgi:hypothetical protein
MNRGWLNTFRRWAGTEAFRRHWPVLRSEFSSEFVRFCEAQLNLKPARVGVVPLRASRRRVVLDDFTRPALAALAEEFAREWPGEQRAGLGLSDRIGRAVALRPDGPLAWLIVQAPAGPEAAGPGRTAADSPEKFACGIVLASLFPRDFGAARTGEVELFAWVRRGHRSVELASSCARPLIDEVRWRLREDGRAPALWARYPKSDVGDDDLEYRAWSGFFARHDFRPLPPGDDGRRRLGLMRRKGGPVAAGAGGPP